MQWRTSSRCSGGGCVEVQEVPGHVLVRSTRSRDVIPLRFTHEEWSSFLDGVKAGAFDIPVED